MKVKTRLISAREYIDEAYLSSNARHDYKTYIDHARELVVEEVNKLQAKGWIAREYFSHGTDSGWDFFVIMEYVYETNQGTN